MQRTGTVPVYTLCLYFPFMQTLGMNHDLITLEWLLMASPDVQTVDQDRHRPMQQTAVAAVHEAVATTTVEEDETAVVVVRRGAEAAL
jgi:hypothetical protein